MAVFDESTPLDILAKKLKKRVIELLIVYALLFGVSFFVCAALVVGAGWFVWELVIESLLSGGTSLEDIDYPSVKVGVFLPVLAVIVAVAWIRTVLAPLVRLMHPGKIEGAEVFREDNPELFGMIDEIAQSAGNQLPGHVFLTDKCDFFVKYTSVLGFFSPKYRVLSLGIPAIMPLNRQEFKAILAHELGHFNQDSIMVSRYANISEFICGTIYETYETCGNSENSIDSYTKFLAKGAYKIMQWQYKKVAPLNGILSRAQELDADRFSVNIAGSEAMVSALAKIECMECRWQDFMEDIECCKEEKMQVRNLLQLWKMYNGKLEQMGEQVLSPDVYFSAPPESFSPQFTEIYDIKTHPSLERRCSLVLGEWYRPSECDNTPALSCISFDYAGYLESTVCGPGPDSKAFEPEASGDEYFKNIVSDLTPSFLHYFYSNSLFICDETVDFDDEVEDEEVVDEEVVDECEERFIAPPFPFTESNARILQEYYIAAKDMAFLAGAAKEASKNFRFLYKGVEYNGANAPVEEYMAYYQQIREKAVVVAMNCNQWVSATEHPIYEMILLSEYYKKELWRYYDAIKSLQKVSDNDVAKIVLKSRIKSAAKSFKELCMEILDRTDAITYIFNTMEVENEDRIRLAKFCSAEEVDIPEFCENYLFIYNVIYNFSIKVRRFMILNMVLPKVLEARGCTHEKV